LGITSFSLSLLEKYKGNSKNVLELGSQNLFDKDYKDNYPYSSEYYLSKGIEYNCVDLNGENNALVIDLSKVNKVEKEYDLVTDFGTSEHVSDLFNVQKFIFDSCKVGGTIIQENPKTGSWSGHGIHYKTKEFYIELAKLSNLEIIEIGEHPAMGNNTDGWNVYCVMKKKEGKFPTRAKFEKLNYAKQ
jgi:hypothetical protein